MEYLKTITRIQEVLTTHNVSPDLIISYIDDIYRYKEIELYEEITNEEEIWDDYKAWLGTEEVD